MMSHQVEPVWHESLREKILHPLALVVLSMVFSAALFVSFEDMVRLGSSTTAILQMIFGAALLGIGAIYLQERLAVNRRRRQFEQSVARDFAEIEQMRDAIDVRIADQDPSRFREEADDILQRVKHYLLSSQHGGSLDIFKAISFVDKNWSFSKENVENIKKQLYFEDKSGKLFKNFAESDGWPSKVARRQINQLAIMLESKALQARIAGDLAGAEEVLLRAFLIGVRREGLSRAELGSVLAQLLAVKQQQGTRQAAEAVAGHLATIVAAGISHQIDGSTR